MQDTWHLAQINVGTARYPQDDPRMQGFMNRLDEINALADASPGFVWRLQDDSGNATGIAVDDQPLLLVNMSVWLSVDALREFAYRSRHRELIQQRKQWFEPPRGAYQALWWIPAGHKPGVEEGRERLALLDAEGPGERAFGFRSVRPPPDEQGQTGTGNRA